MDELYKNYLDLDKLVPYLQRRFGDKFRPGIVAKYLDINKDNPKLWAYFSKSPEDAIHGYHDYLGTKMLDLVRKKNYDIESSLVASSAFSPTVVTPYGTFQRKGVPTDDPAVIEEASKTIEDKALQDIVKKRKELRAALTSARITEDDKGFLKVVGENLSSGLQWGTKFERKLDVDRNKATVGTRGIASNIVAGPSETSIFGLTIGDFWGKAPWRAISAMNDETAAAFINQKRAEGDPFWTALIPHDRPVMPEERPIIEDVARTTSFLLAVGPEFSIAGGLFGAGTTALGALPKAEKVIAVASKIANKNKVLKTASKIAVHSVDEAGKFATHSIITGHGETAGQSALTGALVGLGGSVGQSVLKPWWEAPTLPKKLFRYAGSEINAGLGFAGPMAAARAINGEEWDPRLATEEFLTGLILHQKRKPRELTAKFQFDKLKSLEEKRIEAGFAEWSDFIKQSETTDKSTKTKETKKTETVLESDVELIIDVKEKIPEAKKAKKLSDGDVEIELENKTIKSKGPLEPLDVPVYKEAKEKGLEIVLGDQKLRTQPSPGKKTVMETDVPDAPASGAELPLTSPLFRYFRDTPTATQQGLGNLALKMNVTLKRDVSTKAKNDLMKIADSSSNGIEFVRAAREYLKSVNSALEAAVSDGELRSVYNLKKNSKFYGEEGQVDHLTIIQSERGLTVVPSRETDLYNKSDLRDTTGKISEMFGNNIALVDGVRRKGKHVPFEMLKENEFTAIASNLEKQGYYFLGFKSDSGKAMLVKRHPLTENKKEAAKAVEFLRREFGIEKPDAYAVNLHFYLSDILGKDYKKDIETSGQLTSIADITKRLQIVMSKGITFESADIADINDAISADGKRRLKVIILPDSETITDTDGLHPLRGDVMNRMLKGVGEDNPDQVSSAKSFVYVPGNESKDGAFLGKLKVTRAVDKEADFLEKTGIHGIFYESTAKFRGKRKVWVPLEKYLKDNKGKKPDDVLKKEWRKKYGNIKDYIYEIDPEAYVTTFTEHIKFKNEDGSYNKTSTPLYLQKAYYVESPVLLEKSKKAAERVRKEIEAIKTPEDFAKWFKDKVLKEKEPVVDFEEGTLSDWQKQQIIDAETVTKKMMRALGYSKIGLLSPHTKRYTEEAIYRYVANQIVRPQMRGFTALFSGLPDFAKKMIQADDEVVLGHAARDYYIKDLIKAKSIDIERRSGKRVNLKGVETLGDLFDKNPDAVVYASTIRPPAEDIGGIRAHKIVGFGPEGTGTSLFMRQREFNQLGGADSDADKGAIIFEHGKHFRDILVNKYNNENYINDTKTAFEKKQLNPDGSIRSEIPEQPKVNVAKKLESYNNKSVRDVLSDMYDSLAPFEKSLARTLMDKLGDVKVVVVDSKTAPKELTGMVDPKTGTSRVGVYHPVEHKIYLNKEKLPQYGEKLLPVVALHEATHAATTRALSQPKTAKERAFSKEMKSLYGELKKYAEADKELSELMKKFSINNEREMIAYATTMPEVREKLSGIKVGQRSFLRRIADLISDLLGFEGKGSALEKILFEMDKKLDIKLEAPVEKLASRDIFDKGAMFNSAKNILNAKSSIGRIMSLDRVLRSLAARGFEIDGHKLPTGEEYDRKMLYWKRTAVDAKHGGFGDWKTVKHEIINNLFGADVSKKFFADKTVTDIAKFYSVMLSRNFEEGRAWTPQERAETLTTFFGEYKPANQIEQFLANIPVFEPNHIADVSVSRLRSVMQKYGVNTGGLRYLETLKSLGIDKKTDVARINIPQDKALEVLKAYVGNVDLPIDKNFYKVNRAVNNMAQLVGLKRGNKESLEAFRTRVKAKFNTDVKTKYQEMARTALDTMYDRANDFFVNDVWTMTSMKLDKQLHIDQADKRFINAKQKEVADLAKKMYRKGISDEEKVQLQGKIDNVFKQVDDYVNRKDQATRDYAGLAFLGSLFDPSVGAVKDSIFKLGWWRWANDKFAESFGKELNKTYSEVIGREIEFDAMVAPEMSKQKPKEYYDKLLTEATKKWLNDLSPEEKIGDRVDRMLKNEVYGIISNPFNVWTNPYDFIRMFVDRPSIELYDFKKYPLTKKEAVDLLTGIREYNRALRKYKSGNRNAVTRFIWENSTASTIMKYSPETYSWYEKNAQITKKQEALRNSYGNEISEIVASLYDIYKNLDRSGEIVASILEGKKLPEYTKEMTQKQLDAHRVAAKRVRDLNNRMFELIKEGYDAYVENQLRRLAQVGVAPEKLKAIEAKLRSGLHKRPGYFTHIVKDLDAITDYKAEQLFTRIMTGENMSVNDIVDAIKLGFLKKREKKEYAYETNLEKVLRTYVTKSSLWVERQLLQNNFEKHLVEVNRKVDLIKSQGGREEFARDIASYFKDLGDYVLGRYHTKRDLQIEYGLAEKRGKNITGIKSVEGNDKGLYYISYIDTKGRRKYIEVGDDLGVAIQRYNIERFGVNEMIANNIGSAILSFQFMRNIAGVKSASARNYTQIAYPYFILSRSAIATYREWKNEDKKTFYFKNGDMTFRALLDEAAKESALQYGQTRGEVGERYKYDSVYEKAMVDLVAELDSAFKAKTYKATSGIADALSKFAEIGSTEKVTVKGKSYGAPFAKQLSFGGAEYFLRKKTFELGFTPVFKEIYERVRATGASEEDAVRIAYRKARKAGENLVNLTQFDYHVYNSPASMRKAGIKGDALRLLLQFKKYPINYYKMLKKMMDDSISAAKVNEGEKKILNEYAGSLAKMLSWHALLSLAGKSFGLRLYNFAQEDVVASLSDLFYFFTGQEEKMNYFARKETPFPYLLGPTWGTVLSFMLLTGGASEYNVDEWAMQYLAPRSVKKTMKVGEKLIDAYHSGSGAAWKAMEAIFYNFGIYPDYDRQKRTNRYKLI